VKSKSIAYNKEEEEEEDVEMAAEINGSVDKYWIETCELYKKHFQIFFEMESDENEFKSNKLKKHLLETDKHFSSWYSICNNMVEQVNKV